MLFFWKKWAGFTGWELWLLRPMSTRHHYYLWTQSKPWLLSVILSDSSGCIPELLYWTLRIMMLLAQSSPPSLLHVNALRTIASGCMRNKANHTVMLHRIQFKSFNLAINISTDMYLNNIFYFSYLFPWKNQGGVQLHKAKHFVRLFRSHSIWWFGSSWSFRVCFVDRKTVTVNCPSSLSQWHVNGNLIELGIYRKRKGPLVEEI